MLQTVSTHVSQLWGKPRVGFPFLVVSLMPIFKPVQHELLFLPADPTMPVDWLRIIGLLLVLRIAQGCCTAP